VPVTIVATLGSAVVKDSLTAGVDLAIDTVVTPDMAPPHLPVKVLSTPSMVSLMEQACLRAVAPHLDEGETTVGTHICVSHLAAANAGEVVTVTARLSEVRKRRLTFEVRAAAGERVLGEGTHERAVIDSRRFAT
jgi:fluoroacetyl-CoA thioesterase